MKGRLGIRLKPALVAGLDGDEASVLHAAHGHQPVLGDEGLGPHRIGRRVEELIGPGALLPALVAVADDLIFIDVITAVLWNLFRISQLFGDILSGLPVYNGEEPIGFRLLEKNSFAAFVQSLHPQAPWHAVFLHHGRGRLLRSRLFFRNGLTAGTQGQAESRTEQKRRQCAKAPAVLSYSPVIAVQRHSCPPQCPDFFIYHIIDLRP